MDVQGRSVAKHSLKPGTNRIELRDLPEGLYFVKDGNGAVTKFLLTK